MLTVDLPPGSRRGKLREQVDSAYFKFVDGLPAPLQKLGLDQSIFSGQVEDGPFAGPSSLNPDFSAAPWLFWRASRELPDDQLQIIAQVGGYLGISYVILDHLVDDQLADPASAVLFQQACFDKASRLLRGQYPSTSPFWNHFDRLWAELRQTLATERQWQFEPGNISLEEFKKMAGGKSAPVAIILAAVAEAIEQPALLQRGEGTLKEFGAAAQLAHDVSDWRNDVEDHHFTYFLGQAVSSAGDGGEWVSETTIQQGINNGWLDVVHLKMAKGWLDLAQRDARDLDLPGWSKYLEKAWQKIDKDLDLCQLLHILRVSERAFSQTGNE